MDEKVYIKAQLQPTKKIVLAMRLCSHRMRQQLVLSRKEEKPFYLTNHLLTWQMALSNAMIVDCLSLPSFPVQGYGPFFSFDFRILECWFIREEEDAGRSRG